MRALTSRVLVALLVLSQTWTGALRGLELCIPVGLCEGCGLWFVHAHAHHAHGHQDHAHHDHAHHAAAGLHPQQAHSEPGCICHIHVETPDDDTHRGTPPCAAFMLVTNIAGDVDSWILAAQLRRTSVRPRSPLDDPPEGGAPPKSERVLIEATVLLV